MSDPTTYPRLIKTIDDLRHRWRQLCVREGGLLAAAAVAIVLLAVVVVDNVLAPGVAGRSLLALVLWASVIFGLLVFVLRRFLDDRRDDFFAALVERKYPELNNRFINGLQLGKGNEEGVSRGLIAAIVSDAEKSTADLELSRSLDTSALHRAAIFAVLVGLLVEAP